MNNFSLFKFKDFLIKVRNNCMSFLKLLLKIFFKSFAFIYYVKKKNLENFFNNFI
jgi:hypothetical protein